MIATNRMKNHGPQLTAGTNTMAQQAMPNTTFMRRFQAMEELSRARGRDFRTMDLAEQDALWEEVKNDEAGSGVLRPGRTPR